MKTKDCRTIIDGLLIKCTVRAFFSMCLLLTSSLTCLAETLITNEVTQEVEVESVMVVFHGQELFEMRAISSVPAETRAERIGRRLKRQARSPLVDTKDFEIFHDDELKVSVVMLDGEVITTVWNSDAEVAGISRKELAEQRRDQIKDIIDQYRKDHTTENYIQGGIFAAIATVVYLAIWFVVSFLRRKEIKAVEAKFSGHKMLKFIDGDTVVSINETVMKIVSALIMLAAFVFYLNIVLMFFPWTFNLSAQLFDLISTPIIAFGHAFVDNLPNLFVLLVIWLLASFVLRGLKHVFGQIGEGKVRIKGFYQDWADTTYTLIRTVIVVFAAVVAFPFIPGSGSPAFKGISIFMGVLVSLGSSSAVGNIFGGLMLTYMRSFMPGDFVEINGMQGTVLARRTFSTRLKTVTNEIISIPNSAVSSNHIINYSRMTKTVGVNIGSEITIGYDVPWRTVHELLLKAAEGVGDVLQDPPPRVLQLELGDFYVKYKLIVSTKHPDRRFRILSNLHQNIQDQFAKAGVEIMSPHYQANRAGEKSTIPAHSGHVARESKRR